MKTILVTAYAVNPDKGSEDGMGWNFILQIARYHKVIAVTRKNNRPHIEKYFAANNRLQEQQNRIQFLYFDWPKWMIFWKKGALLSMIYYYCWQLSLALWLKRKNLAVDVVHNLNFHNDWTPTFLWLLRKPLVWGPVGHHPKVPKEFLSPYGKKEYIKDRFLWMIKNIFWKLDPLLYTSKRKASHVLCMNNEAVAKLRLKKEYSIMPSVASEMLAPLTIKKPVFTVLSIGRFVPLKGFDVAIKTFAAFYKSLPPLQQSGVQLTLVGAGPYKHILTRLIAAEGISDAVTIIEWMPRHQLPQLYQSASVFLFPSHEGAGMVVAEAMSYSLPVVCWQNSGPGEFLHPQSTLSVPYTSYKEGISQLANCLRRLYSSPSFCMAEGALAQQRFQEWFQWDIRGEQIKGIYQNILSNPVKKYSNSL